jgi:uncharacterized protein YlxP (DUF503 family)
VQGGAFSGPERKLGVRLEGHWPDEQRLPAIRGKVRPNTMAMVVGVLQMRILVRDAQSLKDKRRVVRSLKDRIRNDFNVSVSEVDALDQRQTAILGVTLATNDRKFADEVLAKVVDFVRRAPEGQLVDYEVEML